MKMISGPSLRHKLPKKGVCPLCQKEGELTKDHIMPFWFIKRAHLIAPLYNQRELEEKNYRAICQPCNGKKGGVIDWEHPFVREYMTCLRDHITKKLEQ